MSNPMDRKELKLIAEHWDSQGIISHHSDAQGEYETWKEYADEHPDEWNGDELTAEDFREYIKALADYRDKLAWSEAQRQGLVYHWAWLHVGGSPIDFVGTGWGDGGIRVDEHGEPRRDARGNTVAKGTVHPLDPEDGRHRELAREWYWGE
jgi:hypothetical protein